jgi:hypothetical protein
VPPLATSVCEYAAPEAPEASDEVEIVSCVDATVIDSEADLVCTGLPLSLTLTVKVDVPLAVGFPEITPPELSVNPAGRLPEVIDHL